MSLIRTKFKQRHIGNATIRNKTKQKHNTMYFRHHYAHTHTHTNNVNKTCALQQTTDKTGTKHRLSEIDANITNVTVLDQ
jgi:hypothetical protein